MTPPKHECIQGSKFTILMWVLGILVTLTLFSSTASATAVMRANTSSEQIAVHDQALRRVDGTDRDIAVIKQQLQSINETLKDIKDGMRRP